MATQQAKGRFWGGDDTDSDESSGGSSSDGSQADNKQAGAPAQKSRFAAAESESESEDEGRIARSAKDRTFEGLQAAIKVIANHLKINNWVGIQEGE